MDARHRVAAFEIVVSPGDAWRIAREIVKESPRTLIVEETDEYLRAECRSALFRFVDDLELQLRPNEGIIAVRSASRVGYSDLGANRRRVEALRAMLVDRRIIR